MNREILVYADWADLGGPQLMGILQSTIALGKEVFAFSYDKTWLNSANSLALDPDLRLFTGPQYLPSNERSNFGLFGDSSPDRWGEVLMRRREAAIARSEGRRPKKLMPSDYLLGVHDQQRMGALRMAATAGGPFLDNNENQAAPPWTTLRKLKQASWKVQDEGEDLSDDLKTLSLLIAPGSSLGGARPKAGVQHPNGDLWIAKFPGRNDEHDTGAWEWVTWKLAAAADLRVPEAECHKIGNRKHHTFATQRFDRVLGSGGQTRIHFASAMTMLGYNDGSASHTEGVSYLEIVDFLSNQGANVSLDLEELWRRIVFSICVSNTDDHLRNHGFLLSKRGWELSPAYDINPNPLGTGLSLNINEDENCLDLELAREIAEFCRLKPGDADQIIAKVKNAVSNWRNLANEIGISRVEQESMSPAFEQAKDSTLPPPEIEELKYWISQSGKRHNSSCRHFKPESGRGRLGTELEGVPCGKCGG